MSKATEPNSIPARVAPSRRALFGAGAALLVGASALAGGAVADAGQEPDAAVIALADEIMSVYRELNRVADAGDTLTGKESDRFREEWVHPLVDREWDLRIELALLPATTLAGFRAKARVLQEFNNCAPGYAEPCNDDAMAWSLANDLLGVPSVWREDDGEVEA